MSTDDLLLRLLGRFREEGAEYVLVGGQAVRLNGYLRATEDVDVLVKAARVNGEKIIRALSFLESSRDARSRSRIRQVRLIDQIIRCNLLARTRPYAADVFPPGYFNWLMAIFHCFEN